jgi:mono/diheme cytochrome c family protein
MTARKFLRGIGYFFAGLCGLMVLGGATVYGLSTSRQSRTFTVADHPITPRTDSASLANGARLVRIHACVGCHGENLGGTVMVDNPVIGRLAAPNITMGGRGAQLDARDWERAIRHAVRRDGPPLRVMPGNEFNGVADDELESIVGYVKSVPPVTVAQPPSRLGPLIATMFVANKVPLLPAEIVDHNKPHAAHVEPAETAEYGMYLAQVCIGCHGPGLSGGRIPGGPPDMKTPANITPTGIGRYSEADFMKILRTGERPDGSHVDPEMPWQLMKSMNDLELKALYAYLKTVPPKEFGNR